MSDEHRQTDDDALLSALIDDELSPDEAARLRARLANEPALAARYESLWRADRKVRRAFASAGAGPMPEGVLRLLRESREREEKTASSRAAKVVPLPALRRLYRPPVALAAGVALFFLGFALARVLLPQAATAPGPVFADPAGVVAQASPLYRVLENVPSGETAELKDGLSAMPRLTFARTGGGYCRLLEVAGEGGVSSALACRRDDAWHLQLAAFTEKAPTPGDGYRLASGSRSPAVESAIDDLMEGAPLGVEAEAELLRKGWSEAHSP